MGEIETSACYGSFSLCHSVYVGWTDGFAGRHPCHVPAGGRRESRGARVVLAVCAAGRLLRPADADRAVRSDDRQLRHSHRRAAR